MSLDDKCHNLSLSLGQNNILDLLCCNNPSLIQNIVFLPGLSGHDSVHFSDHYEATNRFVFGLITWFARPGKSNREFVYICMFVYIVWNGMEQHSLVQPPIQQKC